MEAWLPERVRMVVRALLEGEARTPPAVRQEILDRAAQPPGSAPRALAPDLAEWVDRVAHRAFDIGDADLDRLRSAGHDEDEIFEVTVAAALGAGLKRLRKGLSLLRGMS